MHFPITLGLLAVAQLVAGHGAIIKAVGDAGGAGSAIGVDPDTPRDGTRRNPFQQDSTRFKGDNAATCGQTLGQGENDIETGVKAVMSQNGATLPQISAGGSIDMTLHQVNADGAGPYTCMINSDATGGDWKAIKVTTQVPGKNSNDRSGAMMDLPLKAAIPDGQTCTGTVAGQQNVCMVRCQNAARAGPFGGCVPAQMVVANSAAASNGTVSAAGNSTANAAPKAAAPKPAASTKPKATARRARRDSSSDLSAEDLQNLRDDGEEI